MTRVVSKYNTLYLELYLLVTLIFLSTFRSFGVGADTLVYLMFFQDFPNLFNFDFDYLAHIEIGFRFFLATIKIFTHSEEFFLFLSSAFCIIPVYLGLKKLKLEYALVGLFFYFLIFFINYPNSVIRQGISMGLFVLSLPYMRDRQHFMVLLLGAISSLFHTTGFIIFLCYIFTFFEYKKALTITLLFSFVSFFLYKFNVLQYLIFNYIGSGYEEVYTVQFSEDTSLSQYLYRVAVAFLIGFLIFRVDNDFYKKLFLFYLMGFFVYIALSDNNLLAARFNMFFRMLELVLIPYALTCIRDYRYRLFFFIVFFSVFLLFFIKSVNIPYNQYRFSDFI
ncbi:EpsG family protein [Acinetobacter sp. ANC 4862]|uniref:EpsG family protein n=1 Tax=Acinetobacter sp. ANC 4862 TaxID=2529849 RepID=UPI0013F3A594|nr:EpsG family protein [Acinetobacter sp. ANC 4862]